MVFHFTLTNSSTSFVSSRAQLYEFIIRYILNYTIFFNLFLRHSQGIVSTRLTNLSVSVIVGMLERSVK